MTSTNPVIAAAPAPRFLQQHHDDAPALRAELHAGLVAPAARIAPKHFYDLLGSRLFEAITALPEYYPTRTEAAIFAAHAEAMATHAATRGRPLVDLGAGNGEKAASLFAAFRPSAYVAVDISVEFLRGTLARLGREHPALPMLGVGIDFASRLELPAEAGAAAEGPRTLFYPGSSIGNFEPEAALGFLRQARAAAQGGALVIGVDLVKEHAVLEPAYDDALGVTAAFNRNVLRNVNARLGSDFEPGAWRHVAFYDEVHGRIEMHLEAVSAQPVRWPGGERRFAAAERIQTEYSYKHRPEAFQALLELAGFRGVRAWFDPRRWFGVFVAQG
jgi:dimethylhistidine N-methyltransferase